MGDNEGVYKVVSVASPSRGSLYVILWGLFVCLFVCFCLVFLFFNFHSPHYNGCALSPEVRGFESH